MAVKGHIPTNPVTGEIDSFWYRNWFQQLKDFCFRTSHVEVIQTANFTCRSSQFYPCNTTGGALIATFPPALGIVGRRYTLKNYDGVNTITATPAGADTIEGAATYVVPAQNISVTFVCDGVSNWYVDCCDEGGVGGGAALAVADEGGTLDTGVTSIDFVGGGVTATNVGHAVTVTVPAAPAVVITTQEEGVDLSTIVNKLNFVGAGITGSGAGATTTVTVPLKAPLDAQYVTLAANADLTVERVLTAGANITLTDAGAGSTLTIAAALGTAPGITHGQAVALFNGFAGP